MLGLGVGIDYALFIVTTHRETLARGMEVHESVARAVATSGGAVLFAGTTVVVAVCSLAVAGIPLVTTLGLTTGLMVAVAVVCALTLLPAILASSARASTRCRCPAADRTSRSTSSTRAGRASRAGSCATRAVRRRRAGDPDPAVDPRLLAALRADRHGRAADEGDRARRLRRHRARLRRRHERPDRDRRRSSPRPAQPDDPQLAQLQQAVARTDGVVGRLAGRRRQSRDGRDLLGDPEHGAVGLRDRGPRQPAARRRRSPTRSEGPT